MAVRLQKFRRLLRDWCGREESNLHGLSPQRPQRCASTISATTARSGRFCPGYGYGLPSSKRRGPAALANLPGGCKVGLAEHVGPRMANMSEHLIGLRGAASPAKDAIEWLTSGAPVP